MLTINLAMQDSQNFNDDLKSIPWRLAEFYHNGGLQRLHTRTCIIMQETINRFLCQLILLLLKSKIRQLNLKDVVELNSN